MDSRTEAIHRGTLPGAVIAFFEAYFDDSRKAGGHCAVVIEPGAPRVVVGGSAGGTAVRHAISAISALLRATPADRPLIIGNNHNCDATKPIRLGWLTEWIKHGWTLSDGRPVPDADAWREVAGLLEGREVAFCYSTIHHRMRLEPRPWAIAKAQAELAGQSSEARPMAEAIRMQVRLLSADEAFPLPPRDLGVVHIITSAVCKGNFGDCPGGYAALIRSDDGRTTIRGREAATTSPRLQMQAAAEALATLPAGTCVVVYVGDEFISKGMSEWIFGWKRRGWKKADKTPPLNVDLWQRLDALSGERSVTWKFGLYDLGSLPPDEQPYRIAAKEAEEAVAETGWVPGAKHGFKDESQTRSRGGR